MRLTIFQLLAILLTATVFLQAVHAVPSARQAWTDGFWQTLPDDTEEETSSAKESVSTPAIPLPPSALQPCPRRHILYLDVFSWHAVTVIIFISVICAFARFHAWYQSPSRWMRRLARRQLRQWLRSNSNDLPEDFSILLRQAFSQPDDVNLLQLADNLQAKHPPLAESLRQFEHARFSSGSTTEQATSNLRKYLKRALMAALLLCLAACTYNFSSQWQDATKLAQEGRLQESLDIFTELSKTHSSWQLSKNIAVLHSHLDAAQAADVWNTHSQILKQAYGYGKIWFIHYAPELLLPLIVALICTIFFHGGRQRLLLAMAAIVAMIFFTIVIRPRWLLTKQAVVTVPTALLPVPSENASPAVHLTELPSGAIVKFSGNSHVNDCIQVEYQQIQGWIPKRNVHFFPSP